MSPFDQQRPAIPSRWHVPLDDPLELRQRTALPVVEARVDDLGTRLPRFHLVRAATGGVGLEPRRRPGVGRRRMLLGELRVVDRRHRDREVGHRHLVLAQELDAECVIVDDLELVGLFERPGGHLEGREAADRNRAVVRPLDVVGRDRRAVVEFGVLAQLEGCAGPILGHLPAFGQFRLEFAVVIGNEPVGQRLLAVGQQAVVGDPGHTVARAIGTEAVNVQRVGTELVGDDQRFGAAILRLRGQCTRERERGKRDGASEGGWLRDMRHGGDLLLQ